MIRPYLVDIINDHKTQWLKNSVKGEIYEGK